MKITLNSHLSKILNKRSLILEDVYYDDMLKKLIDYILSKLRISNIIHLSFKEILDKLPDWWPGKKYLKKEKNLTVVKVSFNDKIKLFKTISKFNFTDVESESIFQHLEHDNGLYCTNSVNYNKNEVFLFLDADLPQDKFYDILCHELIHLFQDISGRSKYTVNENKLFNLSEEDKNDIESILKLNIDMLQNIFSKNEIITYIKEAYSYIKRKCNFTKKIDMNFFLVEMNCYLTNKANINSFKEYFNLIKDNIKDENIRKIFIHNNDKSTAINLIIIAYYLSLGVNTIKNHLYGYMNKDNWDKIKNDYI